MTVVDLLQQLVRIPSVNPDHASALGATGEADLAEWLADWLTSLGAQVELEPVRPGRPNLIARWAPRDGRPRLLLGPHLDTIGIEGMSIDPFSGTQRDGRIWGRGASDTKGSMAAMLWGLQSHHAQLAEASTAVDFVAFMGEESRQWGSRQFAATHARDYEFALVGEPTELHAVHATKGCLWATLRTRGRAGHASQPDLGDNAVLRMARVLPDFEAQLRDRLAAYPHPVLGLPTVNVGTITGGSRPNVVPDTCEIQIDLRTTPAMVADGGAEHLVEQVLATTPLELVELHQHPPMELAPDHPWIQRLQSLRPACQAVGAPWFSDAAHLAAGGLAAVCLGPGSIRQAHTADEFIEIADLEAGAAFFHDLVAHLLTA